MNWIPRNQRIALRWALAGIAAIFVVFGCNKESTAPATDPSHRQTDGAALRSGKSPASGEEPDLTGKWKGPDVAFEVSKEDDLYRIVATTPDQKGPMNGTFAGKYQDGTIKLGLPLLGNVTYSKSQDRLYFSGQELNRVKRPEPHLECKENLSQIDGAKEQYALEFKRKQGDKVTMEILLHGVEGYGYMKAEPHCPSGGIYTVNPIGEYPVCSIGKTDPQKPHVLE